MRLEMWIAIAIVLGWLVCGTECYLLLRADRRATADTWTGWDRYNALSMAWLGPFGLLLAIVHWLGGGSDDHKPVKW